MSVHYRDLLAAHERQAWDLFNAQSAAYRDGELTSIRQGTHNPCAVDPDSDRLVAATDAVRISGEALWLQTIRYEVGKTTLLQEVDAERREAPPHAGVRLGGRPPIALPQIRRRKYAIHQILSMLVRHKRGVTY